jgi:hypothetical protein
MLHSIEMGWFILDKYYNRTDEVPVYAAALLLDPSKRSAYIRKNWITSWIEPAMTRANTIWEKEYMSWQNEDAVEIQSVSQPPRRRELNELDRLVSEISVVTAGSTDHDDFMAFINVPPFEIDCTPLAWWCRIEQRSRYPRLSRMAIAILSIPPESAEAERVFSGARRTCTWDRLSLSCTSIEMIECIGNWIKQGLIALSSVAGLGLVMDSQDDEVIPGLTDEVVDEIPWFIV